MTKFLLDANMSPRTAEYLSDTLGLDAIHLTDVLPGTVPDDAVVAVAKAQGRVIITFDTDFGEIHHFREHGLLGVMQLKLKDQTLEAVHPVLTRFFTEQAAYIDFATSLVVIELDRIRIVRPEEA